MCADFLFPTTKPCLETPLRKMLDPCRVNQISIWPYDQRLNGSYLFQISIVVLQNNYVDRILPFFDPPPPAWTVFIPWAWAKTDIFWPPPPSTCQHNYWMPPNINEINLFLQIFLLNRTLWGIWKSKSIKSVYFHDLLYTVFSSWSNFKNKVETSQVWYFVTKIVLTYCEKKSF